MYVFERRRELQTTGSNKMVAVIDLCALDTAERQAISSTTSIILNSLPLSTLSPSPLSPSRLKYIQSTSHPQAAVYVHENRNISSHFLER